MIVFDILYILPIRWGLERLYELYSPPLSPPGIDEEIVLLYLVSRFIFWDKWKYDYSKICL